MNIGKMSPRTGPETRTICFYENASLVDPAARGDNGYQQYGDREISLLTFVQRSRGLGFSVENCRELRALCQDKKRSRADVRSIALCRISETDEKISLLAEMRAALSVLVAGCRGDSRPDCPILNDLAGG
jgi:Cu(I)-responsive transcriptional regulator